MGDKILIVGPAIYAEPVIGLGELSGSIDDFMENPEEYKLVMFSGGEDVSPNLYGHTSPQGYCHNNPARDAREVPIFTHALKHNIQMTGICRGSQFINVMSGGVMMHHITGHSMEGNHHMTVANLDVPIAVTSTHHQMSVLGDGGILVAKSTDKRSKIYLGDADKPMEWEKPETEGFVYPETNVFGVQYHPEYMPHESTGYLWYRNALVDFMKLTIGEFVEKYALPTKEMQIGA